ncbi:MAG: hypothetical protein QXU65_04860 [Sulfolobales archaeon]
MNLEVLVLYRLAGKIDLLYALRALSTGRMSYREVSERYGVNQGSLENAFRELCSGRYQLCARVLPIAVDVVLSKVPSVATRGYCGLCGIVVSNLPLHLGKKHRDVVEYYTSVVRSEVAELLRRESLVS